MEEFLQALLGFIVPFFAVVSMAGAGLGRSIREVTRPLRSPAFLAAALIANFVLVPVLAYGIARLLNLEAPYAIGLFLLATVAGAPFLVALVRAAKTDLTLATGLLVTLMIGTIIYMPLVLPAVLPWAEVRVMQIAPSLLLTMFLPLVVGLVVHAVTPRLSAKLGPLFGRASQLSLIILVAATFLLHLPSVIGMVGSGALAAAFLFTLGAFLIGYTLGGRKPSHRAVLGLATGQRSVAAATIVATQVFEQSGPLVMVVVSSLVAFVVLFPAAYFLRRSGERRTARQVGFESPGTEGGRWRRA
jgi:bile acid:Na+ symporter, BASS family